MPLQQIRIRSPRQLLALLQHRGGVIEVLDVVDELQAVRDVQALGVLIKIYWKPLYFFVRQKGNDNETSKDAHDS